MPGASFDFAIGSRKWPGISKLIEECGEVMQVAGKLIATGGAEDHWDGTNLRLRLEDEIADLEAALWFVNVRCDLDFERIDARTKEKLHLFYQWHDEQLTTEAPPAGNALIR